MTIIPESARVGADCEFGQFTVIGEKVSLGEGCRIGHHVVIHDGSRLGSGVRVDDGAVIGKQPMRAANSAVTRDAPLEPPRIGDRVIVGTGAIIYAGADIERDVLIADLATIREDVTIGRKSIIGRGVAIENSCRIGIAVKIETNAYITAYSVLEDRVFIAPGVVTTNDNYVGRTEERFKHFRGVTVRRGGRIGANATILPGKQVGADGLVAAGSVVTRDTPDRKIVAGAPARPTTDVAEEQLLDNQGWVD